MSTHSSDTVEVRGEMVRRCPTRLVEKDEWYPVLVTPNGFRYDIPHWSEVLPSDQVREAFATAWNQFINILEEGRGWSTLVAIREAMWSEWSDRIEALEGNIRVFLGGREEERTDGNGESNLVLSHSEVMELIGRDILKRREGENALMMLRFTVLVSVMQSFVVLGRVDRWEDVSPSEQESQIAYLGLTRRARAYYRAVISLKSKPAKNLTDYFNLIAAKAPKADGESPAHQAARSFFQTRGDFVTGDSLQAFREKVEAEALKLQKAGALEP